MSMDVTEAIDEYCEEHFGHTNWGWVSSYDKVMLKGGKFGEYIREGDILFFLEPDEGINKIAIKED